MNTKEKILDTTEKLILKNGIDGLTLSEVAKKLQLSQPAIYKHFKNKEQLLTTLAFNWLDTILEALFPFDKSSYSNQAAIAHDWLWTLASSKKKAYEQTPDMFALYTTYIAENVQLSDQHFQNLFQSFQEATAIHDEKFTFAVLLAFSYFHHPMIAPQWDENFPQQFETVWQLVKKNFDENK